MQEKCRIFRDLLFDAAYRNSEGFDISPFVSRLLLLFFVLFCFSKLLLLFLPAVIVILFLRILIGTPFPIRTRLTTQHIQPIRYNVYNAQRSSSIGRHRRYIRRRHRPRSSMKAKTKGEDCLPYTPNIETER